MPAFQETRLLPFSAQQLYDLVVDVGSYPDFLPWCVASRVQSKTDRRMVADLVIGFAVFRERFTSENSLDPEALKIDTRLLKGPFKHLTNAWRFHQREDGSGTDVEFAVDFEFRSKLLSKAIEPMFVTAQKKLIRAFEERAEVVYGAEA